MSMPMLHDASVTSATLREINETQRRNSVATLLRTVPVDSRFRSPAAMFTTPTQRVQN
jgi:hypothetical protein